MTGKHLLSTRADLAQKGSPRTSPPAGRARAAAFWFVAIVALAALLRLYHIGTWDMWTDEVQTLWTSQDMAFKEGPMYRTAPVNFYLTGLATRLLGTTEWAVRMVPLLSGITTVALCYLLFAPRVGRRAGLFATLTLTLSMWHVYWSQTARHFAVQTLLILIGLYAFLRFWREDKLSGALIAAAALLGSLFVHSSSGFYLLALLAFLATTWLHSIRTRVRPLRWSPSDRRALIGTLAVVLPLILYLPIYFQVGDYLMANKVAWNPPTNIVGSLAFYIPPYLALPALAGATCLWRERDDLGLLLAFLLAVPMILVTLASSVTIASGAYCLASTIAVALLVGVACDRLLSAAAQSGKAAMALLVSAIFLSQAYDLAHYYLYFNGLKPRWRAATELIRRDRAPSDLVFAAEGDVAQFYLGTEGVDWLGRIDHWREEGGTFPASVDGIWYALYTNDDPAASGAPLDSIRMNARLVALFPLHYGAKDRTIALYYQSLR